MFARALCERDRHCASATRESWPLVEGAPFRGWSRCVLQIVCQPQRYRWSRRSLRHPLRAGTRSRALRRRLRQW
eukprot:scaffold136514_cov26-Tisochrysis_lutea.AAC.2